MFPRILSLVKLLVIGALSALFGWCVFHIPQLIGGSRMGKADTILFFAVPLAGGGLAGMGFPWWQRLRRRVLKREFVLLDAACLFCLMMLVYAWGLRFYMYPVDPEVAGTLAGAIKFALFMPLNKWLKTGAGSVAGGFMFFLLARILNWPGESDSDAS